jgi:hypothetical protein
MFSLQQNWRTRGWNRFCPKRGGRWPKDCKSKCKNDKIKFFKNEEKNE